MRFDLLPEQESFRDAVRALVREIPSPSAGALASLPPDAAARLAQLGLWAVAAPRELGGAGRDRVSLALALEEFAAVRPDLAAALGAANARFAEPLLRFGTPSQQRDALAPHAAGKALGCLAWAEGPHDDAPMQARAERGDDDSYVLHGTKRFVALGREAEVVLVVAGASAAGEGAATALLVPHAATHVGEERGGCTLHFERVRVAADARVGDEGAGLAVVEVALEAERVAAAARAVGIARGALDAAVAHVKERQAAGKEDLQAVHFVIADMATEIDAARLLALRAALATDRGADAAGPSAMAAFVATETAARATHRALRLFGREPPDDLERLHRAALAVEADAGAGDRLRARVASAPPTSWGGAG